MKDACEGNATPRTDYSVKPLKAPRLAGAALRWFAAAAELPGLGAPLRRAMLNAAQVPAFRGTCCDEAPFLAPPLPGVGNLEDAQPVPASLTAAIDDSCGFAAAYRSGALSPVDIAERFLDCVKRSDAAGPPLRAFIAVDADDLRAQARASAERYRDGRPVGPLDGVPIAVKDELDQTPHPTTVGTRFLRQVPARDATAVARLRAAGALLVGKTNMQEAGLGVTGINPHHGTARNPHDPWRVTGGSSSGSAAAVAAGLCPVAVSADAGGSIRVPSALCGLVGLKPTFGGVSEAGAATLGWSIAHVGAIGATARDVALAYLAMAGPDPLDPNTLRQPPALAPDFGAGVAGLTIGVYRPWFEDAAPDIVAACRRTLDSLTRLGAKVRDVELPDLHLVRPAHLVTVAVEWATGFGNVHRRHRREFGHDVRLILALASALRPTDYVHAQRLRRRICSHFAAALREVDVIATPTTAITAPPLRPDALASGESDFTTLDLLSRFATAANLTGHPAISFPAGHEGQGLPVGLQLIGRPWREDVLLRVAGAAETLVERRPPRVRFDLLGGT
jgi:Asp-tRNA(Asn)/Glu-tRNA(Gln) amidotransferase A subunit family amidase